MSTSHVTNLFIYKKEVQWPSWSLYLNAQKFILSFLRSFPATFFSQLWFFCSSWQFVIGDVLQSCRLFCFRIFLAAEILRIVVSAFFVVRSFSIWVDVFLLNIDWQIQDERGEKSPSWWDSNEKNYIPPFALGQKILEEKLNLQVCPIF